MHSSGKFPLKLVYFGFVIHYGGGPKALVDIAIRLSKHQRVEIIDAYGSCSEYIKDLQDAGIPVHILVPENKMIYVGHSHSRIKRIGRLFTLAPTYLKLIFHLVKTIEKIKPDVVWMNIKTPMLFWSVVPGLQEVPVMRSMIECPSLEKMSGFEKWCLRNRMHFFVAVSSESAARLRSLGIGHERIHVVSDTIDAEALIARSQLPLEEELPALDKYPRIVIPSTILRDKGQHTAIKAVAHLKKSGLDPVLWLAGDVVGDNDDYLLYLKQLAKELRLERNVFFLGWRNDVPAIIRCSDIVAFPTHSEGFGLVVLEAFLMKKPLVTTYIGGIKDQVEEGVNALTFRVEDDKGMAGSIQKLVENAELISTLTANGYESAITRFLPSKNTEGFLSAFEATLQVVKSREL